MREKIIYGMTKIIAKETSVRVRTKVNKWNVNKNIGKKAVSFFLNYETQARETRLQVNEIKRGERYSILKYRL